MPSELGTERIGKLLAQYAIPAIIAQTAASLYHMIDSIFIGHIPNVGADAISGLATTEPRSFAGPEITTRWGSQTIAFAPIPIKRSTK